MNPICHIGTPGVKWESKEREQWLSEQEIQRSYIEDVVEKLSKVTQDFNIEKYGKLEYTGFNTYELYALKSKNWNENKQTILVTGGVHGYETSGVMGALEFALTDSKKYLDYYNIVIVPCVSPWGYETINRWNPITSDPNRSFLGSEISDEANLLMKFLDKYKNNVLAHFDLHETTNTDDTEFRPAKLAKDGTMLFSGGIPDGFYIIGDKLSKQSEFYKEVIKSFKVQTHIAPVDENGLLLGELLYMEGVVLLDAKKYGVCAAYTNAKYSITTEVYPDSSKVTHKECTKAQVAAVKGGIEYLINKEK
jgi:hypothetical protein